MLLIEGLRSLQRPTYLQTPIGGHHHQLRSLDLVGQLTKRLQTCEAQRNVADIELVPLCLSGIVSFVLMSPTNHRT